MTHEAYRHFSFLCEYVLEWITGDSNLMSAWAPEELSNFLSLRMQQAPEGKYQEIENRPQDAIMYHSVQKVIQIVFVPSDSLTYMYNLRDQGYPGRYILQMICEMHFLTVPAC